MPNVIVGFVNPPLKLRLMNNYIQYKTMDVITYPCPDPGSFNPIEGVPWENICIHRWQFQQNKLLIYQVCIISWLISYEMLCSDSIGRLHKFLYLILCVYQNIKDPIWSCVGYCTLWFTKEQKHASLTHWGRYNVDTISQTTFSSAFSWKKMFEFILDFHWSLLLMVQLTIFQHWFR